MNPSRTITSPHRLSHRDRVSRGASTLLACVAAAALTISCASTSNAQTPPTFSHVVVFGDSLSDVGNFRNRIQPFGISFPGPNFNYTDGRFTNGSDTAPASNQYFGVWHEQLSQRFLSMAVAAPSTHGGNCYAFGAASTEDGTQTYLFGGQVPVTIDNMGKQVDDFLSSRGVDPEALYAVWGGSNDFIDDDSSNNVTATAGRMAMLINRLATGGARHFLVPNVPPLGETPRYAGEPDLEQQKNRASSDYRTQLNANIDATVSALAAQGIQITVYRLDIWSLFVRFVSDPSRYGFIDIQNPAQSQNVDPDKSLFWDDIHPTTAGHYQVAVEANRVLTGAAVQPGKAVNISTRANVGTGESVSIAGLIITGTAPKRLIVRGIGPSLSQSGVQGALPNPVITLFDATGAVLATNDDWIATQPVEIAATGIPPTHPQESAIVRTLPPGAYTVHLSGSGGGTGVGLVEVFDLEPDANSTLANVSTRGAVGTGDNVMIAGMIINSGDSPIVVVRAIGPSLRDAGIVAPLQDPMLQLYDGNGEQIASNDDWRENGQPSAAKATLLAPTDDRESAIVAPLAPGAYTAVLRGKGNTTGVALVEAYRIP